MAIDPKKIIPKNNIPKGVGKDTAKNIFQNSKASKDVKNIDVPKVKSPEGKKLEKLKLQKDRLKEKLKRKKATEESKNKKEEINNTSEVIENNTTDDQKAKGSGKLSIIINEQTKKVTSLIIPNLILVAQEVFENNNECPPLPKTRDLLYKYNNIVGDLNKLTETTNKIAEVGNIVTSGVIVIQQISTALKYSIPIISTAAKAAPLIPGVVVSALDDIDWINNNLLYKDNGSPKLPPLLAGVSATTLGIAVLSLNLKTAIDLINPIIIKLEQCLPEGEKHTINKPSSTTKQYASFGDNNYNNFSDTSYKGFQIKIEEVPYTPTVNRRRAVGYSVSGIPLIQTELSFTTDSKTLVTELKFIIDRDNLKAY